jgi:hypothetical protein
MIILILIIDACLFQICEGMHFQALGNGKNQFPDSLIQTIDMRIFQTSEMSPSLCLDLTS